MTMKLCLGPCGLERSMEDFSNNGSSADGKVGVCKFCSWPHDVYGNPIKTCRGVCGLILPIEEFYDSPSGVHYKTGKCKKCRSIPSWKPSRPPKDGHKWCNGCREEIPLHLFPNNKGCKRDGKAGRCNPCLNNRNKAAKDAAPNSKYRSTSISNRYYNELREKQDYKCANLGCRRPESECPKNALVLDHDHNCCPPAGGCLKCVRGLLCPKCNTGEGQLDGDPKKIFGIIQYLGFDLELELKRFLNE